MTFDQFDGRRGVIFCQKIQLSVFTKDCCHSWSEIGLESLKRWTEIWAHSRHNAWLVNEFICKVFTVASGGFLWKSFEGDFLQVA